MLLLGLTIWFWGFFLNYQPPLTANVTLLTKSYFSIHNYIKNVIQHFMRSAFMQLVSIMWWMKLQEIIGSDVYLVQNKVQILSCCCHGWSVHVLPLVPRVALYGLCRTSTCPIQNLLSKFCFSIKAEAVVYGHYSGNTRSRQECNIIALFFCYRYGPDGNLH